MSHNTWLHRIVRPPVRLLTHSPVTPNHLTAGRLITGLAAAICFAIATPAAVYAGALCFFVSMLLDRADGELARQTGSFSAFGHRFDLITDALSNSLVFVGIGIGSRDGLWGPTAIGLGLVAGIAIVTVLYLVVQLENQGGQGAASFDATAGFDPDDAMLAVPVAMALGWADWLVLAAATGAPLAALIIWLAFRGRRAGDPDDY